MKHIAPDGHQRRPVFTSLDKVALATIGAVAAFAVLLGLVNPQAETARHAADKAAAPTCYSIGWLVAPGCSERLK
ncbi:hypothetical protein XH87_12620 [Bradyrhizobium sp. CCBAU 53415]|nr:hypothetical protein [Bradyrhizobium sp. CCBAU 53380]MDA9465419.1 hypothetical protein [Bradyrhizobium sp. CCBAU 53415]